MKNFSLGFLALVLLVGCSAGVPQATNRTQQEAITFLCSDYQRAYYEPLVKSFELANPSITVQLVTTDTTSTMDSDIGTALARTSDAFTYASSILDWSVPQDIVLDLSALAKQDKSFDVQDFYPGALPAFQRDGKLWGLPMSMSPLVVFYDRASFTQAGLPSPRPGWSWDDLLNAALKLTVRGNETEARYGYVDPFPFYTLPILAYQRAKPLVDLQADLRQVRLDRPAVAQALRWYADLALTHQVMPDPLKVDASAMQQLIYNKHAAMWVEDALLVPESESSRTGMAPLPEVSPAEADSPATSLTTRGIFVSAGTTHPEAAWRWVEFLTHQPPASYDRSIPARKSVAEAGGFWNQLSEETASTYRYAIARALVVPDPVRASLYRAYRAVLQGKPAPDALIVEQGRLLKQLDESAAQAQRAPDVAPVPTSVLQSTANSESMLVRFSVPLGGNLTVYQALAVQFHKSNPNINIEISTAAGPAGVDCSLDRFSGGLTATLQLDPLIARDHFDLSAYPAPYLDLARADNGALMGLPLDVDPQLLYYNRSLFDAAGVPPPDADWTPDDFIARASSLTVVGQAAPVYGFAPRDGAYIHLADYVAWLGGKLFDQHGTPTFNDPSTVAALTRYAKLISAAAPPSSAEQGHRRWEGFPTTWGVHPNNADAGHLAMWVDAYSNHLQAPPLGFDAGVALLPRGAQAVPTPDVRFLRINANAQNIDAVWAWVKFLSAQPEANMLLPVRRDIAANAAWRAMLERPEPLSGRWDVSATSYAALYWLDEALAQVLAGASPVAALEQAQAKAGTFVQCVGSRELNEEIRRACAPE